MNIKYSSPFQIYCSEYLPMQWRPPFNSWPQRQSFGQAGWTQSIAKKLAMIHTKREPKAVSVPRNSPLLASVRNSSQKVVVTNRPKQSGWLGSFRLISRCSSLHTSADSTTSMLSTRFPHGIWGTGTEHRVAEYCVTVLLRCPEKSHHGLSERLDSRTN